MKLYATATAALLLIAGACAERTRVHPAENVSAVRPGGMSAASYELRADQAAAPKIAVNVWSDGASRVGDRTFIDLSVQLHNSGENPIALDDKALSLEAFNTQGAPLPAAQLAAVTAEKGSYTVAPHSANTVHLRFELTMPVPPSEVGALRFRWGVVRKDGERYVQFTEFRRQPERAAVVPRAYYDPIYGFYDPFFYGAPYGYRLNYYVPVGRVVIHTRTRTRTPS